MSLVLFLEENPEKPVPGSFHFSIPTFLFIHALPALEMFRYSTKLSVALMVPLALVCLSMMTNVPQRRIPERRLSFKSLHPIHLLMTVKRITVARLTCVWGSFVANYHLTAKGNAAVGGAYPAGPTEERLQRSMCVFKTCFSSNSILPFSPQVFEWEWIHSCCQRPC